MSRLIDADKLKVYLKEYLHYDHAIPWVDEQPTAYDIEKVVAELEEAGNQRVENAFGGREEWEALAYRQGTRKAIELMKGGAT